MKYTLYLCILTALFAFGLSGCGDEKNAPAPEQSRTAPETNATDAAPGGEAASGANASVEAPAAAPAATDGSAEASADTSAAANDQSVVDENDLLHRHFFLKSANGEDYSQKERRPELTFTDSFRIAGGFCNRIMGQASLENGILTAGPLASTRMHCAEDDLNKLEQSVILNLEKGVKLTLDGPLLTLKGEDMELVFEAREAAQ